MAPLTSTRPLNSLHPASLAANVRRRQPPPPTPPELKAACSQAPAVMTGIEPVTFSLVVCVASPPASSSHRRIKTLQPAAACLPASSVQPPAQREHHSVCACVCYLRPGKSANHRCPTLQAQKDPKKPSNGFKVQPGCHDDCHNEQLESGFKADWPLMARRERTDDCC